MPVLRTFAPVIACAIFVLLPTGALAASPADCAPPTQERAGRADGDDPAVTTPATPTCDDGGYDIAYPDAPLASDAPAVDEPGSAALAPDASETIDVAPPVRPAAPTAVTAPYVRVATPSYTLPLTDVSGRMLSVVLTSLMFLSMGVLAHVGASLRAGGTTDA